MSGEDFVSHSIAVAMILAEQLLDSATISAALLHDVVEDSDVRTEDIAREFGGEIAGIVDGLTKISSLTFRSSAEEHSPFSHSQRRRRPLPTGQPSRSQHLPAGPTRPALEHAGCRAPQ